MFSKPTGRTSDSNNHIPTGWTDIMPIILGGETVLFDSRQLKRAVVTAPLYRYMFLCVA